MADDATPTFTNPLQNNSTAVAVISYLAGIAAAKLTFFDLATWNYIFMALGGLIFALWQFFITRKTTVVATAANLPEVDKIELNRTAPNAQGLYDATPENVTMK